MKHSTLASALAAALACQLTGLVAQAAPTIMVNDHGLDRPHQLIDFDNIPLLDENQPVQEQWGSLGVHFDFGAYANSDMTPGLAHMSGNRVTNFQATIPASNFWVMRFDELKQSIAFSLVGLPDDLDQIELKRNGGTVTVASYNFYAGLFDLNNFYVFDGFEFDSVVIRVLDGTDRAFSIDNVQTIAATRGDNGVPEPALPALLMAAGLPAWLSRRAVTARRRTGHNETPAS